MGSCCGINTPEPPSPTATASAQTSTNISTALANSFLNNPNQITPEGSLTYSPSGQSITINDPDKPGVSYTIPRYQATQTLSPNQTTLLGQREGAQIGLATTANTQAGRLNTLLGGGVDTAGNPYGLADPGSLDIPGPATAFGDAGSQQSDLAQTPGTAFGFGEAGDVTRDYGADNQRDRVEQALFERMQPQLDRQRTQLEQRLADQGIRYGSPAYMAAMDDFNRQLTDARLGVIAQGGQEQRLQADIAAQRAGFQNAAQKQAYEQAQGRGAFYNTAAQQALAEAQARGQFANAAQAAAFQQAQGRGAFANSALAQLLNQRQAALAGRNQTRNQYLAELYAARNQPINEISALLSGSQLTQPQWASWNQAQIPTTDIAGLINQNFSQQSANAQMQSQFLGNVLGAAGRIGGSAILSDRRMKKDVHRIGTVFAAEPQPVQEPERKKLPVYEYSYKDDPTATRHVGPMAQDVERIDPGAVGKDRRGVKYINASRTMGSILRAA
jgi:Chaperone of endosialidase